MTTTKPKLAPVILVIFGIASRLLPHPPNFVPITAISLFSGYYLPQYYSFVTPVMTVFLSDLVIGFYGPLAFFVYTGHLVTSLIAKIIKKITPLRLITLAILSSLSFFIISNFGFWATSTYYPKTAIGLLDCYTQAIPFFKNSLTSDIIYTLAIFYTYQLLKSVSSKILPKKIFQLAF